MSIRTVLRLSQYMIVAFLLLSATVSHAERPRIGLVLGGGGARGAAHIGVLKELERHRVPIDAIAGTSMGAIVGGLYASGMTADELEEVVATLDWDAAMSDEPARKDLSFRRKQDDEQYPINFELGLRRGELLLPMGMVQGQQLDLILRDLTIDVSDVSNFDDLPIPFRAIATDIERGESYVMGNGDLAQAIRASMSVPAIFAPTQLDDRLLVDGGITANLPIDVVRDMNVDIVIAVDVEFPLYAANELDSALTISEQMLTILMRRETLRQIDTLAEQDILIRPKLGTFASGNFAEIVQAIDPGAQAAQESSAKLAEIAIDEQAYAQHLRQRAMPRPEASQLAFVIVNHAGNLSSRILESRLEVEVGDVIDTDRLARDAEHLYGLGYYEKVGYKLIETDSRTGVEFQARSKSWGPNVLQFAVSLENDFEGSTAFNLASRLTKSGINPRGAEWRTDFRLGTDPLLLSEFYQPLIGASRFFVAPRIDLHQSNLSTFTDDELVARYRIAKSEIGFDFGSEIGSFGEARVGTYHGTGRARVKIGDPSLPNFDIRTGGILTRLRLDTRDNAQFPRSGLRGELKWSRSLQSFGADDRFDTVEANFDETWSRGKNSWQLGLSYATSSNSQDSFLDYFQLGGFLRLSGLQRGETSGPHAALAKLVYYRRVGESAGGLFDIPTYLGMSAELGNVWQSRSEMGFDSAQFNGSLFAGFDTIIGPVYLGAGFAEGGRNNFYLFFGSLPR